jgi:uracil-DNA glycosylase
MHTTLEPSWQKALKDELKQPYFVALTALLETARTNESVFPAPEAVFKALDLCPLAEVKVVILGQDPYHGEGQAHGLAFSVPEGIKIPPSLKNIYNELESDLNITPRTTGNLENWAKQGVLLLNATLTVLPGQPGSHQGLGWEIFTDTIIKTVSAQKEHVIFLLWGKYAQAKVELIDQSKHLVLVAPHPSPFSAYTGFFGCKHFSKTNEYLKAHNHTPIDW